MLLASQLSVAIVTTNISHSKKLSNLAKIYTNKENYSSYNNRFTFKITMFYINYFKANFLLKAKMKKFSNILKRIALDYYYLNISTDIITMNFDQVYNFIRNYFERVKYKQKVLSK